MRRIRNRKLFGPRVIGAIVLSALIFTLLYPCHEYIGCYPGSITLGQDICDDSPCLTAKVKHQGGMPGNFIHLPITESAIPRIFAHFIFRPPKV